MRVKVSILGHFGEGENLLNGQTVKTKIVTEELQNQLGNEQVLKIDTHGGWKTLLKAPFQVFSALKKSTNVLIFPAHNGLRVYAPLLATMKRYFKKRKLHYVVIGGWLPQFLTKRHSLAKNLRKFDGVYVETNTMQKALEEQGFTNVFVMPNCKKLKILTEQELVYPSGVPYKLCTFSRVMREKGIEDAIAAVKFVNLKFGRIVYTLDIYGQVETEQVEWFEELKSNFPEYVTYGGIVPFDKSVEILKDYCALLFPTKFYTEGIPGTIIDAYAAGVPVICAKWQSFSDIVEDNITGIGYEFNNFDEFNQILLGLANSMEIIQSQKLNCLRKSEQFMPNRALNSLVDEIR